MEDVLEFERPIAELSNRIDALRLTSADVVDLTPQIEELEGKLADERKKIYGNLNAWQRTLIARHPSRPHTSDYVAALLTDFVELHGDRAFRDDPSILCGLGTLGGHSIALIGQEKGRGTEENLTRNFGMPHPEGYRKAMRVMYLADRFHLPIVTLIDTPGAYPGLEAESRGQGMAIAENLLEMVQLRTPIVSVVIGEGGSGGALAIGVADRVLMLENSVYSVISPEGCAAILYRDAALKERAAENLRINAEQHLEGGLIDGVIPEPEGGAHRAPETAIESVGGAIGQALRELLDVDTDALVEARYARYRGIGVYKEE